MRTARSLSVAFLLITGAFAQGGTSQTTSSKAGQNVQPDSVALEPLLNPKPIYPETARQQNIRGQVLVQILVSETGNVIATQVIKGDDTFKGAAEDAAKRWTFKPFIKNGAPVLALAAMNFGFGDVQNQSHSATDADSVEVNIEHAGPMPTKVRVSAGVIQRLQVRKVSPVYPEAAKKARVQGAVVLGATIGMDGAVREIRVVSGPPELTEAAIDTVRQWLYKPYVLMGHPVEVETQFTVNFTLNGLQ